MEFYLPSVGGKLLFTGNVYYIKKILETCMCLGRDTEKAEASQGVHLTQYWLGEEEEGQVKEHGVLLWFKGVGKVH